MLSPSRYYLSRPHDGLLTYAFSIESVNGVEGRRVRGDRVRLPEPAGPQGTFAEGDGGFDPGVAAS